MRIVGRMVTAPHLGMQIACTLQQCRGPAGRPLLVDATHIRPKFGKWQSLHTCVTTRIEDHRLAYQTGQHWPYPDTLLTYDVVPLAPRDIIEPSSKLVLGNDM